MTDYSYDQVHEKVEKILKDLPTEPNPEDNHDIIQLLSIIAITLKDIEVNQSGVFNLLKAINYKMPE